AGRHVHARLRQAGGGRSDLPLLGRHHRGAQRARSGIRIGQAAAIGQGQPPSQRGRDRPRGAVAGGAVGEARSGRPHGRHRQGGAAVSDVLYVNGRFTTTDERVLGVEDRGFQFGDAVYEVFKFLGRSPAFLSEHYRRLVQGLAEIEIVNPWPNEAAFASMVRELLDRTAFDSGIVYI